MKKCLPLFPLITQSFFSFNKEKVIAFNRQVTIFVTEEISCSFFVSVGIGKVDEAETFLMQFAFACFGCFRTGWNKLLNYAPVLSQNVIYISYIRGVIAVKFIVVSVAAPVVAEFFINTAFKGFTAFETGFVGGFTHDKGGLVSIKLGIIIRLQTFTNG
ncbi:MAG: hypothetical protein HY252_07900 [Sphingobacteriales bacterium]|nr:hypothetical protein [Sphingobacteriales bacterium]